MNKRKSQLRNLFPICKKFFMLYKVRTLLVLLCLICSAISTIASSVFIQQIISLVETTLKNNVGTKELFESIQPQLLNILFMMIIVYGVGIASSIAYTQIMAVIGQDFLNKMRIEMFERMESLPIKYFDRHKHGDIMSFYTNDVDTLRQFICQSLPQCISTALSILFAVIVMLSYSLWLFLIVIAGAVAMLFVTAKIGGNSARFFMKQQISMAKVEG